jgi:chaperonin GroEL
MTIRKVKTSPKMFVSEHDKLKQHVLKTMSRISEIVGSTYGPGGKNVLIESDYPGIPNKNTKDGVTVFKSLGASNAYEHLIIEQARDAAQRTASEAGDGTTTATILASAMVEYLYSFCESNPKYSPQKAARELSKIVRNRLIPRIQEQAIRVNGEEDKDLLRMVAKVSANGDDDMADVVIKAFEMIGFGDSSHVTIKEVSGAYGYEVDPIEGLPIPIGYEESMGKFHTMFINDQANQRCFLENPLFLLYDGQISDMMTVSNILTKVGMAYTEGDSEKKNIVIFAHGYSEGFLTQLAINFPNPNTINIVPMTTPLAPFANSQLQFLMDLSAFTGAKVFGLQDKVADANMEDLGNGMTGFEAYRFRSTIIGDSDQTNVEVRVEELKTQKENAASQAEKMWLEERLGKITGGIAKITVYGGSNGELKEAHDRVEDAVCSVRSAISKGALPGGCRVFTNLAMELMEDETSGEVARDILVPTLMTPITRLLDNAGYTESEAEHIISKMIEDREIVYDVENQEFGSAQELGVFDAAPAVEEALKNATSIAAVLGTIGGLVAYPRDEVMERSEASADMEFQRMVDNPLSYKNEANERP